MFGWQPPVSKTQDGKIIPVDLLPVQQVKSLADYRAVILGTALRFEAPISDTSHFVKKFNSELQNIPFSLFSVGVYMRENTPEMRTKTLGFLEPVLNTLPQPITTGLFAGVVDYEKMAPFWRFLVSKDSAGFMREGDWRDWDAIQAWAEETGAALLDHMKLV